MALANNLRTLQEIQPFKDLQAAICDDNTLLHFGVMLFHLKDNFEKAWITGTAVPANQASSIMFLSKCLTKQSSTMGLPVACLV
ncbi:hypothetical protein B0H63DRAFT_529957 [Podospora didyma]|uniref:Uncharacterized protein n=1 Tax=Podospora didyma TaxID=330526 RepID=A0AAE0N1E2_9PEZI|nr:hypothetical protein B0H63DRAFT_529957 [Podospora didyma]